MTRHVNQITRGTNGCAVCRYPARVTGAEEARFPFAHNIAKFPSGSSRRDASAS